MKKAASQEAAFSAKAGKKFFWCSNFYKKCCRRVRDEESRANAEHSQKGAISQEIGIKVKKEKQKNSAKKESQI